MAESVVEKYLNAQNTETNGDLDSAMSMYASIANQHPEFKPALVSLGSIYLKKRRVEDAMFCFEKSVELEEDYLSYYNLGSIYYMMSDYKKSVICLEKSKRINPSFHTSILLSGLCYYKMKNNKAAEKNMLIVLKTDPDHEIALSTLAFINYRSSNLRESLFFAEKALKRNPSRKLLMKLKSDILYEMGRLEDSAVEIKNIKKNDSRLIEFDKFLNSVPTSLYSDKYGTIDSKIDTLKIKAMQTSDPKDLIALSLCHLFKGETDSAIDYLYKARAVS